MTVLARRDWVQAPLENYVQSLAAAANAATPTSIAATIADLARQNRSIHERECFNLNPAANVMNPKAEALLADGLGSRPSLGYPGGKYEMGLEAVEQIEVYAAALAARVFSARFAEVRVASGALANLYCFMATAKPGDAVIVPPPEIGGHVTHHNAGAAGLYGLDIHYAPTKQGGYTVDVGGLADLARRVRPKLITLGASLNLEPHPIADARSIADEVGAKLMFDAAHACGMIAGGVWANPLDLGAHMMTMSTYKSLGGPAGGLIVTNDAALAQRLDAIAFPGLTANFDAGRVAALTVTLADWIALGADYAVTMRDTALALVEALAREGLPVFRIAQGATASHQFALEAARFGGGHAAAKTLRQAGLLSSAIGLPIAPVAGDANGLRLGTPEICRWGMTPADMPALARLIARALASNDAAAIAAETAELRSSYDRIHFIL